MIGNRNQNMQKCEQLFSIQNKASQKALLNNTSESLKRIKNTWYYL